MSIEVTTICFLLTIALCLGNTTSFAWIDGQCPCTNVSLCQPIQVGPRREKFAFIVDVNNWRSYNYSQITTIAMFIDQLIPEFLCFAHSQQVRLVWPTGYDTKQLGNATARMEWIRSQVDKVKSTFADGINIDVEGPIKDGGPAVQQYTSLVQEVTELLHTEVPGSQVKRIFYKLKT